MTRIKLRAILRQMAWFMPIGIAFGFAVGYASPMSYPAAIAMCVASAFGIQIFESLTEVYLFPKFEGFSRGKKLTYRMTSSLVAHILGWLLPIWITSMIIVFSLFRPVSLLAHHHLSDYNSLMADHRLPTDVILTFYLSKTSFAYTFQITSYESLIIVLP